MSRIDHFMYAVPSLDDGMAWAADTFDAAAVYGGEHVGLGTRNALLSLGDVYLEIIAPDPRQNLDGTLGEQFAALSSGGLVTWAVQGTLFQIAEALNAGGLTTQGPVRTQRRTAEGDLLVWELLFPRAHTFGPCMPFFIDWLECPHPSRTAPAGGAFGALSVSSPSAGALHEHLAAIGLDLEVTDGASALAVSIRTGRGEVVLESTPDTIATMV